ncbi:ABC transporter permease [Streptomyces sp. WZ-12]|uniref:ABC transporter permease n=1 Tax=Streptomyces sp. WZ-12 TaxID=3030210 RepID=UPI0023812F66|nr:ABC transporter permease [Streptomyces sp. WZ-12]
MTTPTQEHTRLHPARLTFPDVAETGSAGLRGRPMRVVLSALGIAIGIATMIAVVGISSSSKAKLLADLDKLGTNMLVVTPGQSYSDGKPQLPKKSPEMIARIDGVEDVGASASLDGLHIYRSEHIPATQTSGLTVQAAGETLLQTVRGSIVSGTWLNNANSRYPALVLGDLAAQRLGVSGPGQQVYINGQYFTVIGVMGPLPLVEDLRTSALVGWDAAKELLGFDGHPTSVYERSADSDVEHVRDLLARTTSPQAPHEVKVSNPSDALAAKAASEGAFTKLLLGLGGVALLVGGVGVANTMIISVLERRHEIGLRRSLGATRGQIRLQFVTESLLLSGLGGIVGIALGSLATWIYATTSATPWLVPPIAMAAGFAATLLIGSLAGLYPAVRAARLSPTLALHTT